MKISKHDNLQINFARNLKLLRNHHNLSQHRFARRCGLSQGYVSMLESGERTPVLAIIGRIAKTFGISPEDLLKAA